jgi:ATP:ADP antiporter, AAA family
MNVPKLVQLIVFTWSSLLHITTVEEAKEFYPLFGLGANVALIFSGRTVKYFSNMRKNLGPGVDGWAISLKAMMSIVVALGLVITRIYWGVNRFVIDKSAMPVVERKKKVGIDKRFIVLLVLFMVLFLMML